MLKGRVVKGRVVEGGWLKEMGGVVRLQGSLAVG